MPQPQNPKTPEVVPPPSCAMIAQRIAQIESELQSLSPSAPPALKTALESAYSALQREQAALKCPAPPTAPPVTCAVLEHELSQAFAELRALEAKGDYNSSTLAAIAGYIVELNQRLIDLRCYPQPPKST